MEEKLDNQETIEQNEQEINSESQEAETKESKKEKKKSKKEKELDKLEDLGKKLEETNDKYLRLYSDFENFRKRTSKEKIDLIQYASEGAIKDLLTVVDDFERALQDIEKQESIPETSKQGLSLVYNKLQNYLTQKGVSPIVAKGEKFDENLHEAVTQFPAPEPALKDCVIDEVTKGYKMYDKVIRFSKVVVGI